MTSYLEHLSKKYYDRMRVGAKGRTTAFSPGAYFADVPTPDLRAQKDNSILGKITEATSNEAPLGKIIDLMSRPAYAVGNTLKEAIADPISDIVSGTHTSNLSQDLQNKNILEALFNSTTGAAMSGLSGRSKVLPSDAIFGHVKPQNTGEGVAKFAGGFAADVLLDPLTWVGPGAVTRTIKSIPAVSKITESLRAAGVMEKSAKELPDVVKAADDVAEKAKNVVDTSIKDAPAGPAIDVNGKRVYDFKDLPSLFATPHAPTPASSKGTSLQSWVKEFADRDLRIVDDKLRFTGTSAGENGFPLRTIVENARATKDSDILKQIKTLFEDTKPDSGARAARSAPTASEAASVAEVSAQRVPRVARLQGAQRVETLKYLKERLSPEDYLTLARTRSSKSFDAARREILSRSASPAKSIAEESEASIKSVLSEMATPGGVVNPASPDVKEVVEKTLRQQLAPTKEFKYRTTTKGTARNARQIGIGEGISDRAANARAQYTMYKNFAARASSMLKGTGFSGAARGAFMRERLYSWLDEADTAMRSRGIEPILGEGNEGLALSTLDILKSLEKTSAGDSFLLNHVFDLRKGNISLNNLMDATEALLVEMKRMGVKSVDDIPNFMRALRAEKNSLGSLYDLVGRSLAKDTRGAHALGAKGGVVKGLTKTTTKRVWDKEAKHGVWEVTTENMGGAEFSSIINQARKVLTNESTIRELVKRNAANSARYNAQMGYEVQRISDSVVSEFFKTWGSPTTSAGEAIATYESIEKLTDKAAEIFGASPAAYEVAKTVIKSEIEDAIGTDVKVVKDINRVLAADTSSAAQKVAREMHNNVVEDIVDALEPAVATDIGATQKVTLDVAILRAIFPFLSKMDAGFIHGLGANTDHVLARFMAHAGNRTIRPALTEGGSVVRNLANHWRDLLTQVHYAFPDRSALEPIFVQLQNGVEVVGNFSAKQQEAIDTLTYLTKILFEPNAERGTKAATSMFFRNATDVEHINMRMAYSKLPESMRFNIDTAEAFAKANGTTIAEGLANQWKTWKITDPIDFLARMQHVATSVATDTVVAREAARIATEKGLMSTVQRKGFVQIFDSTDKSILARYLPEGAWYDKDIVEEIKVLDRMMQQSMSPSGEWGRFVTTYLDPMLNAWKAGMTIYRPGHHVRNLIGDSSLSFLADGMPKVHQMRNAISIMHLRGNYDGWSALRAIQGLGPDVGKVTEATLARGDQIAAHITLRGGRKTTLTAKQIHDYARSHGMLPDFVSGEDLLRGVDTTSETVEAVRKSMSIFNGKVRAAAGRTSEARDDFVRLSHMLQILEKNKSFKTTDELLEYAVRRVRKWHPDGTDMTHFESVVMRRIFPFYSWTRKSIPLVVESMLMNPGRVMVWPKATYNAAKASGIDVTSISDPFPKDQLFPSFLTDEMTGPVADINGNYYNVNPGLANVDVMNQFIGSPKSGILSMLTPFIKVPTELASGNRIDTGSKINDVWEYLGSNVPGVAQAQSMSGVNVLGSAANGSQQNITAVERGNRGQVDPSALYNYLLGLGVQNMSKPSYVTYAQIEEAARLRRAAQ